MRFLIRDKVKVQEPDRGAVRLVTKFLWLPKQLPSNKPGISSEVRWLERAMWKQFYWWDYQLGGEWRDLSWVEEEIDRYD